MESISFPDCLCQRAESEAIIYIYTEGLCELESQTCSSRQYLFAPRTLGCFVPLGWASLFTLTLSMRQGSIQCRYLTPERPEGVLCLSTLVTPGTFLSTVRHNM